MNFNARFFLAAAAATFFLAACNVNVNEGGNNPNGNIPLDSGTTVTTHTESHTESHSDFEIKGGINSESHTTNHTTTTVGTNQSLGERLNGWKASIFPDYKDAEMDPLEAYPKYDRAQATLFARLRRRTPISNKMGTEVYPRVLLKAYRFGSPESLSGDVEEWLNTMGSTTKNLKLGQKATVKSPPLLCAVLQNDFLVVQAACVYEGPEWEATKALFYKTVEEQAGSHSFEVACKSGELRYTLGGADPQ